ncbi:MAG: hypothetical protein QNJ05_16075, partial [Woeseiaceae bacterium]|nr:hypothetical protein [Woeseiaceae bacterium]
CLAAGFVSLFAQLPQSLIELDALRGCVPLSHPRLDVSYLFFDRFAATGLFTVVCVAVSANKQCTAEY